MALEEEGNITVVVRIRPQNQQEQEHDIQAVVEVVDENVLVFDPKEDANDDMFSGAKFRNREIPRRKNKDLKFVFDRVFSVTSTQQEIFEFTTKHILDGVLNGYNCSVFAYGATGSGKTHTMLGSVDQPGVMYHTMVELYERIEQMKDEKICEVAVSYLEVYNEQIQDLLDPKGSLAVREDPQKGTVVQRLSFHQPKSAKELLEMLANGNLNRTQHPTDANATSSRSHAVFQVYVKQQDRIASISKNLRIAKMCLIDLAGSERANATKAQGARFREGANINRSLLALGNVINSLADNKAKRAHIPYRDSKLTRLLKDSLGGNCRTVMIATISPSAISYEDTYNTLKYANRAKDIKSSLKSNVVSLDCHISKYAAICEELRKEVTQLKEKLKTYEDAKCTVSNFGCSPVLAKLSNQHQRWVKSLQEVFADRQMIQKSYFDLEALAKEMELKTSFRLRDQERIKILCTEQRLEQASCKFERSQASSNRRRDYLLEQMQQVEVKLKENGSLLSEMGNKISSDGRNQSVPQVLKLSLQKLLLETELNSLKQHSEYITQLMMLQDRDRRQTEKLVTTLLQIVRKQFYTLKEANLATAETVTQFNELERLVRGEKVVLWADQINADDCKENQQSEITALATFSKLNILPDKLFEFTGSPKKEELTSHPTEQTLLKTSTRKRPPTKRCLTELRSPVKSPQRVRSSPLKKRRMKDETASCNPATSELRRKRKRTRTDPLTILPKVCTKENQPFSNRSNTLGNEGINFMNSVQQRIKRNCPLTVTNKRIIPVTITPKSCNFPVATCTSMTSKYPNLNETFETTDAGDHACLNATITIGPSDVQRSEITVSHNTFPQAKNLILQRLGQPQIFTARNPPATASRPTTQRKRRSLSGISTHVSGQNRSKRSQVCKNRPLSARYSSPRLRSVGKKSTINSELPSFPVSQDFHFLPQSNSKNSNKAFAF
ncbi:kinesin-like protein KIF18A isoform X1 [Stegostoma tigrinum]|uniref:kinesin-like protein KIF18A isoform X1 n=1 Tax=Stegostoma tigrinum TaxID=3053191 RepID=UPI00202B4ACE|nr:kinesin-like protein KIF18A isoform X1 [Stegostoma tigrinum]